ncbi:type VI secretion system protein ImpL [Pseudomonas cuatrocienegasensis]|uniref:Type VI secretion system protein ImpL n=1 Tax=Pseudomonas cuatrocienegasensis TaxID=543360 RepID=A0ABY1BKN6_9PSED|nr:MULTISPECIES: type VI secretion protein IcmF/TssM N-terminal domain-containing protein [Pseudomonas]OEC34812.1 type VI secretion system protein ImpL [Pseudomonas sp. 21C1]SER06206.1 type VI secretion system protein ImpL [Pseudomonas cuatrocienegasensis]
MSSLAIILSVLGIVLLLLALAALFWWLRTQSGTAMRSFYAAVRKMEHEQGIESRYQTPWLMLLGDPREGRQLCAEWQLNPVGRPAWFGRWWADQDGALLVVPQTLFLPEDGGTAPTFVWRRLLGMLLRLRGQRPLDGIIWTIPLARLEDDAQGVADVITLRRRFSELLQHLGLSLPVHVLITGIEDLPGVQELLAALPEAGLDQPLGWSSPYGLDAGWQGYWLDDAVDQVIQALQVAIMEVGAVKGELAEDLYRLPDRLHGLKGNIRTLLEPVFQGNAQGEAAVLRGIYFSAEQVIGNDPHAEWAVAGDDQPSGHGVFSKHLWRQRFLVEQGLAKAVPRILRLRQRWQKMLAGAALVIGACWLVAMLLVWQKGQRDARELTRLVQMTLNDHVQFADPARSEEQARQNLQGFWNLLEQAPRWQFASLVYPSSWVSSLDGQMDYLLRAMARSEAMRPLAQMQHAELLKLLEIRNSDRRPKVEGEHPADWPNYVKARSLALGVYNLEQQNHLLRDALSGDKSALESLAQLGNSSLGLGLDSASLAHHSYYDRALRGLEVPGLQPLDLEAYRDTFSEQFQVLMKFWLTQYFLAENFVRPAGYLRLQLDDLKAQQGNSLKELETINGLVGSLEDIIILTNSAWSHSSSDELVPGYRNMLEKVRQSSLLGPTVEASLNSQAAGLRSSFYSQWIEGVGGDQNLLQRQPGGGLALQEHVSSLDRSIKGLLQRDFVVVALRSEGQELNPHALGNVDELALLQALNFQQSYRDFVTQELALIPPDYRGGMLKAAGQAVVLAMWSGLSSASERRDAMAGHAFDISAKQAHQVMQALRELNRPDLAGALQAQLTRRAVSDIDAALATIDALPVFSQRFAISQWDGGRNLGLQLYRASDVQELKTSLAQQYEVIASSSEEVAPALDWLRAQPDLSIAVQDKLHRLHSIADEMLKYKAQNPTSTPALFEQLVARDFVEMDLSSCSQVLATANVPNGGGDLALRGRNLREQAAQRCNQLLTQGAAGAWNDLADYFNQYLANRFPFAYSLDATDADPARVQHFLALIDSRLAAAEQGLKWASPMDRPAAEDFLARLKQARNWLGPLFVRDESGILGVELDVRWRTDREDERGADQVIGWSLHAADRQIAHPGEVGQRLHWNVGDPLQVMLRWARDSEQRPSIDPLQPSMAVSELEAGWEYRGPWALMRLLRSHIVMQRQPSMDYTEFPLTLQVPVRGAWDGSTQARMFMRLSLLSQGSKLPLSIPPLPVMAPRSPFTSTFSASVVGSEVTP